MISLLFSDNYCTEQNVFTVYKSFKIRSFKIINVVKGILVYLIEEHIPKF